MIAGYLKIFGFLKVSYFFTLCKRKSKEDVKRDKNAKEPRSNELYGYGSVLKGKDLTTL